MQLDKETMKKIRWLIAFAVLLYLGVQNLNIVINTAKVLLSFLFPFIIGFGIAFILNVPMKFIEHHLFGKALEQKKKAAEKLARPISLVLSIGFVICIIIIVMLVVVPELGSTFVNIAKKIEENIPAFQKWIDNVSGNNPEIVKWTQSLNIEPGKMIRTQRTQKRSQQHCFIHRINYHGTPHNSHECLHRLCLCLLCSSPERKTHAADKKSNVRIIPGKAGQISGTRMESGKQNLFQFHYRPVHRSSHPRKHVLRIYDNPALPICHAGWSPDLLYSINSCIRRNHWMLGCFLPDPDGKPDKSSPLPWIVPYFTAD